MFSRLRKGLAAVFLPLIAMVVFAQAALAYSLDNTAPDTTGCSATGITPIPQYFTSQGVLELRFSRNCATAWARFTCTNSSGCSAFCITTHRVTDNTWVQNYWCTPPWDTDSNGVQRWSNQLYDGGSLQSEACIGSWWTQGTWYCTGVY